MTAAAFVLGLVGPADAAAADRLRADAYAGATWFALEDAARIRLAADPPGTEVLGVWPAAGGPLVATMAVTAAGDEAQRSVALGADIGALRFPLPSLTVGRLAVAADHQGFRLNHAMRDAMLARAEALGVEAICSSQAAGTPNMAGMEALGYRFFEVDAARMQSVRVEAGRLVVNLLTRAQFATARERIGAALAARGVSCAWRGPELFAPGLPVPGFPVAAAATP